MIVRTTKNLVSKFDDDAEYLQSLIKKFKIYKSNPDKENFYFGKDVSYHLSKANKGCVVYHVHLVPYEDEEMLNTWWEKHNYNNEYPNRKQREKTSDSCLIYVKNSKNEFLLIDIFKHPTAHKKCKNQAVMNAILTIAEDYYCLDVVDGKSIL